MLGTCCRVSVRVAGSPITGTSSPVAGYWSLVTGTSPPIAIQMLCIRLIDEQRFRRKEENMIGAGQFHVLPGTEIGSRCCSVRFSES